MNQSYNEKFLTFQGEKSHSLFASPAVKTLSMNASEIFRERLLAAIKERGTTPAQLSKAAGLNARAVKDIEEQKTRSPKISTVFALAKALDLDPAEMMGLPPRHEIRPELAAFLEQYSEETQSRFLSALAALSQKSDRTP